MRRFPKHLHILLCLWQTVFPLTANQAIAQANVGSIFSQSQQVGQYEQILFGAARPQKALATRVKDLEINLFGRVHNGEIDARLVAIGKMLGHQKPAYLLPPMAPTLGQLHSDSPKLPPPLSKWQAASNQAFQHSPTQGLGVSPGASPAQPREHAKDLLLKAVERYGAGDTNGAEKLFREVLVVDPQNGDAHFNLGAIAEAKGNLDLALSHYKSAQKVNLIDSEVAQAVKSVESQIQARREAEQQAHRLKVAQAQADRHRLELQQLAGKAANAYRYHNYDEAISHLNVLVREAPDDAQVHYALAQAYRGKGDLNSGRRHINKAVAIDPRNQLYKTALLEIDKEGQSQAIANADNDNTPAGKITPFAPDEASPLNNQNGYAKRGWPFSGLISNLLPGAAWGQSYGYMPEITYRSGGSGNTRLQRAAIGGLTGAAVGALMGKGTEGGVKRGAIGGAVVGGLAGFFLGGN